jgi:hypothetical protein
MHPFPNFGDLEIFVGGSFQALASIPADKMPLSHSGVALYVITDQRLEKGYGFITKAFSGNFDTTYKTIAKCFRLFRARVSTNEQFLSVTRQAAHFAPHNPFLQLMIVKAHGNFTHVRIGEPACLYREDISLIRQVFSFVDPTGGDIIFDACLTANAEEDGDSLVASVSRIVPGCNVYGSSEEVCGFDPIIYQPSPLEKPKCFPLFKGNEPLERPPTCGYVAGQKVVNSNEVEVVRKKMMQKSKSQAAL